MWFRRRCWRRCIQRGTGGAGAAELGSKNCGAGEASEQVSFADVTSEAAKARSGSPPCPRNRGVPRCEPTWRRNAPMTLGQRNIDGILQLGLHGAASVPGSTRSMKENGVTSTGCRKAGSLPRRIGYSDPAPRLRSGLLPSARFRPIQRVAGFLSSPTFVGLPGSSPGGIRFAVESKSRVAAGCPAALSRTGPGLRDAEGR